MLKIFTINNICRGGGILFYEYAASLAVVVGSFSAFDKQTKPVLF
jgi:hypothetical protein